MTRTKPANAARRLLLKGAAAAVVMPVAASAAEPGRTDAAMMSDWPWLGRYAEDNSQLKATAAKIDIVFIGDSITEIWPRLRPAFFTQGRVCRGIGGQTSPQILLRMMADVVALKPKTVHILAGTNDIAGNTGMLSPEEIVNNLLAMTQLARANNIRAIVGTVTPSAHFPWRPELNPAAQIIEVNRLLRHKRHKQHFLLADYHPAMAAPNGALPAALGADGVHPDAAGYAIMERILAPML